MTMAIKNTPLGGADWATTDYASAADFNDTFDAAYNLLVKNARFWDVSTLRTLYDDCGSGAATFSTLWTASGSGTHSESYTNTSIAGGTAYEMDLTCGGAAGSHVTKAVTVSATANRSYHFRVACGVTATGTGGANGTAAIYFVLRDNAGVDQNYLIGDYNFTGVVSTNTVYTDITIVRTAADTYDVFAGGKKIVSGGTTQASTLVFGMRGASSDNGGSNRPLVHIYADDFYYSNAA